MRLFQVTVRNFRALTDVTVDLDETTILIGENNTGKTAFLEALKLCLSSGSSRRSEVFDEFDHHLPSDTAVVGDAGVTEIILRFGETQIDEWPADLVQAINDAIYLDGDLKRVDLRVSSSKDASTGQMESRWEFLDAAGNPLRPRRPATVLLRDLQEYKPFFYLSAVRDASREFQPRSAFWGPFLRNPAIAEDVLQQIETAMRDLNAQVIAADPRLKDVKARLEKSANIVSISPADAVAIEAVPARARDLLSRSHVSISGRSGARLPMTRHGAGTQSLSVLFLFEAFLTSMLADIYGASSIPIIAIEEPEAHLHPSAARSLWSSISTMPGQKIVATHSGDLLSRVPWENVRRFALGAGGGITVHCLTPGLLTSDDLRKIATHVRSSRGELLFARAWLLVEGSTEYSVVTGLADILGHDLDQLGVRVVPYANIDVGTMIRLANEFGIPWFCLADGDTAGMKYKATALGLLSGAAEADRVLALAEANIEVHLCVAGFGAPYEANISPQKRSQITVSIGDPLYWNQVYDARSNRSKDELAHKAVDAVRQAGKTSVPPVLRGVIESVVRLANRSQHGP